MQTNKIYYILGFTTLFLFSCNENKKVERNNVVKIHKLSPIQNLNPITNKTSSNFQIIDNLFQKLLNIDHRTLNLVPVLAVSRPEIKINDLNQMLLTYTLRPDAQWADGKPIVAKDVAFSIKAIMCPGVDSEHLKPYFESFIDIILYPDPKKLTIVSKSTYIRAEYSSGVDFYILPEHILDPKGILSKYTLKNLLESGIQKQPTLFTTVANKLNSFNMHGDTTIGSASGAYAIKEFSPTQKVVLSKKENWWGEEHVLENNYFKASMNELDYIVVTDINTAKNLLKSEELDVLQIAKPNDFEEMQQNTSFSTKYNFEQIAMNGYSYFGINMKNPKFKDKYTRKAIACLIDYAKLQTLLHKDYSRRVNGPLLDYKRKFYQDSLIKYDYNIEQAKEYLKLGGWGDSDGNGIFDKIIDGKKIELSIELAFNVGNEMKKMSALIFKESAEPAGVKIELLPIEWSVFLDRQSKHDFDMYHGSWVLDVGPDDPSQIFHTHSANGGSNVVSFGNKYSDQLIDSIKITLDERKRMQLWNKLENVILDEVPYVFLFNPTNFIIINKKFDYVYISPVNPGYWEAGFELRNEQE